MVESRRFALLPKPKRRVLEVAAMDIAAATDLA
jgi:hypothetical protein